MGSAAKRRGQLDHLKRTGRFSAKLHLVVIAFLVGAATACSRDGRDIRAELVRSERQADVVPKDTTPVPVFDRAREISYAFSPPTNTSVRQDLTGPNGRWVMSFNDETSSSSFGWAFSDTPNVASSWSRCNALGGNPVCTECDPPMGPPGCTGSTTGKLIPSDIVDFGTYLFDPTVAADGLGNVVSINLATSSRLTGAPVRTGASTGSPEGDAVAAYVVASVSVNGGKSFTRAQRVNDDGATDNTCQTGDIDQPAAVFDTTSGLTPHLWVVWRDNTAGAWGACVRRGHLSGDTIVWDIPPLNVDGLGGDTAYGIGGVYIQAARDAVTLVYSDTGHIFQCPEMDSKSIGWRAATSHNGGHNWDDTQIIHTDAFKWCVFNQQVQNSLRAFSYVRVATATGMVDYVAAQLSGSQISVSSSTDQGATWRELCAVTPENNDGDFRDAFWSPPHQHCFFPAVNSASSVDLPTLAVDGDGRLALAYHEEIGEGASAHYVFRGCTDPLGPRPFWQPHGLSKQGTEIGAPAPLPAPISSGDLESHGPRLFGDYETMIATEPTTSCGKVGTFFPGFAMSDAGGVAEVFSRQVKLSNP